MSFLNYLKIACISLDLLMVDKGRYIKEMKPLGNETQYEKVRIQDKINIAFIYSNMVQNNLISLYCESQTVRYLNGNFESED